MCVDRSAEDGSVSVGGLSSAAESASLDAGGGGAGAGPSAVTAAREGTDVGGSDDAAGFYNSKQWQSIAENKALYVYVQSCRVLVPGVAPPGWLARQLVPSVQTPSATTRDAAAAAAGTSAITMFAWPDIQVQLQPDSSANHEGGCGVVFSARLQGKDVVVKVPIGMSQPDAGSIKGRPGRLKDALGALDSLQNELKMLTAVGSSPHMPLLVGLASMAAQPQSLLAGRFAFALVFDRCAHVIRCGEACINHPFWLKRSL